MNKFPKIALKIREHGGSLSMMNLAGNPPLFYVKDKALQTQLQTIDSRSSLGV